MKIDGKYREALLHADSKAALSTLGVLGDTLVDINSQFATGPRVEDGGGAEDGGDAEPGHDVVEGQPGNVIESLNQVILAKMNTIVDNAAVGSKGSVGKLINGIRSLYNKADATVNELHTLEMNLNNGRGSIGKLMTDDTLYNRLNATAAQAAEYCRPAGQRQGDGGQAAEG